MALAQLLNEGKYGLTARSVNELIDKLISLDWYSNAGQCDLEVEGKLAQFMSSLGVHTYDIKWISKDQVTETIGTLSVEGSDLWDVLKEIPDQLKKKIEQLGHEQILKDVIDKVPEAVFHGAYQQAYRIFADELAVKFLVGHAMYLSTLICTAELAGEENPFSIIVELLEEGHMPLGPKGNTFYLL